MEKIIRSTPVTGSRRLSESYSSRHSKDKVIKTEEKDVESRSNEENMNSVKLQSQVKEIQDSEAMLSQSAIESNYLDGVLANEKKAVEQFEEEKRILESEIVKLKAEIQGFKQDIQAKYDESFEQGKKEGLEAGGLEGLKQHEKIVRELRELSEILKTAASKNITGNEEIAVEIALITLCRIVEEKIVDKNFVVSAVKNVIHNVAGEPSVVIRVNPAQLDNLSEAKKEFESVTNGDVKLVPDARVIVGGCLLETDKGNWDGRLETQLQKLIDLSSNSSAPKSTR